MDMRTPIPRDSRANTRRSPSPRMAPTVSTTAILQALTPARAASPAVGPAGPAGPMENADWAVRWLGALPARSSARSLAWVRLVAPLPYVFPPPSSGHALTVVCYLQGAILANVLGGGKKGKKH